MKPDFALSLSSQGITLLLRAAGGWRSIGTVAFDAENLDASLAELRQTGEAHGLPLSCKLILPNDQIRYLSVDTGDITHEARRAQAGAAVANATPYALEELAFDISPEGTTTHVAAVALETLDEAQGFAEAHGFTPTSFVAVPNENAFLGEPFFGATKAHKDVIPDGIAVVDLGAANPPAPQAPAEPVLETELAPPAAQDIAAEQPALSPQEQKTEPSTDPETEALASRAAAALAREDLPDKVSPTQPTGLPETLDFGAIDALANQKGNTSAPASASAVPSPAEESSSEEAGVGFVSRRAPRKAEPVTATKTPVAPPSTPRVSVSAVKAAAKTTAPALSAPKAAAPAAKVARPPSAAPQVPTAIEPPAAVLARIKPKQIAVAADSPEARAAALAKAAYEKGEEAPIAVSKSRAIGGKPRYLGLMLTSLLLLFMAVVAAVAYWTNPADDLIEPELVEPRQELSLDSQPVQDTPDPQTSDTPLAPIEPLPDATGETTPPEPPDQISSLSPTSDPAPPVDDLALDTPALSNTDAAVLDALTEEAAPAQDDERAQRTNYAATGIWQQPPSLLDPLTDDLHTAAYVAAIDQESPTFDAIALPNATRFDSDLIQTALPAPTPAESIFDLDERGLVIATPEGTLNPDGIIVYLGRPSKVPPPAPERPLRAAAPEPEINLLALARPRLRPADLQERAERAQTAARVEEELSRIRPRLRPADLQPAPAEEAAEPEIIAALPSEGSAPTRSVVPQKRPSNLSRPAETGSVAAAVTTPRIPSSASVAREATVRDAINLRDINLIGISGTPRNREALVRLPSGRLKKLKVGDTIDGGRVTAIDEQRLLYQKRGRNHTLRMPNG